MTRASISGLKTEAVCDPVQRRRRRLSVRRVKDLHQAHVQEQSAILFLVYAFCNSLYIFVQIVLMDDCW